jgi:hypothetical protein
MLVYHLWKKFKMEFPYDPAISLLGIHPIYNEIVYPDPLDWRIIKNKGMLHLYINNLELCLADSSVS